jgi:hypothetical protein
MINQVEKNTKRDTLIFVKHKTLIILMQVFDILQNKNVFSKIFIDVEFI